MKKSLLALAALSAFAGAASAQSSVTLFGIVDVGPMTVKNGSAGRTYSLTTDGINTSRIGFRGIEDLGGGLRAGFWIEGAIGADSGCGGQTLGSPIAVATTSTTVNQQTGRAITQPTAPGAAQTVSVTGSQQTCTGLNFQRRTTASLIGNFGEVRMGRDYTPTFNNISAYDPFGYNGVGHLGNLRNALGSGAGTLVRANNTIAYFLPSLGGVYGQVQVAAGEGVTQIANTSTGNKEVSGRIGYAAGPVNVGGAYMKTYKTGSMVDKYTTWNVGGSFNFGYGTVQGAFEKNEYSTRQQKVYLAGILVPLGNGTFKASYVKSAATVGFAAKQYAAGYVYDLSKRTALYAQYAYLDNLGAATNGALYSVYGTWNGTAPTSTGGGLLGFTRGQSSKRGQVGVRHVF